MAKSLAIFAVSDVHLEMRNYGAPLELASKLPCAQGHHIDLLILAGDIGNPFSPQYSEFIDVCLRVLPHSSHLILVAGNHEHYYHHQSDSTTEKTISRIREVVTASQDPSRVHFLERDSWQHPQLPQLFVHGCTLWSDAHPNPRISGQLNDFSAIRDLNALKRGSAVNLYRQWHRRDREWLAKTLDEHHGQVNLVVTHHLPSFRLVCEKRFGGIEELSNRLFASECDELVERSTMWFCGHSHESRVVANMVLNPLGYPGELQFNPCDWKTIHRVSLMRDPSPDRELAAQIESL